MIEVEPGRPGWVQVTFRHACTAAEAALVGEFNGWDATAHRLQPEADGSAHVKVDVPIGRAYRFRYLLDGARWENDWAADAYVPNEYGGSDSVVDLTADGPHAARCGALGAASRDG